MTETAILPSRDKTAKAASTASPLYAAHEWVYSRSVKGPFRRLKWAVLGVLLGLYYLGPWLRWDRGPGAPDQALLIDMPARRAYLFAIEIWPQEIYYLTGLLILGAIGLFFVTALAGRVWCGFACPQTVWTDLFLWAERLIEGDRAARMRLDAAPLSVAKAARKALKHGVWLVISVATGGAWILYFEDAFTVTPRIFAGEASMTVYFFIGLFTATTYLLAGWAREQVCIYMCPWPRFQSAMFDEHSLIVTYEAWRGEPRGRARLGDTFAGRGHCVDCGLCHQVCPTGVDIRKGQQLACIGCALCVDACRGVMDRFGLPRGLITYDSIANQAARAAGLPRHLRLVRPRTLAYVAVLLAVAAVMAAALTTRARVDVSVLHDRAPLFVRLSDGAVSNGFTYKILNMERQPKTFRLELAGVAGARLKVVGVAADWVEAVDLPVAGDDIGTFRVLVRVEPDRLHGRSTGMVFRLKDQITGQTHNHEVAFSGPGAASSTAAGVP
ncbi:cytochrome c oxidase accessory protein CcoG [Shumkonia mesophila]|uniref:cytochrome c oxidase accessory protein CcoG n=1 Tax=Shumkonia mesophila TaxID=2838854 RepID=UPI002934CD35|nr:cytochrome c oxidase accessory protein CcoG [Shumkonia mesophila]